MMLTNKLSRKILRASPFVALSLGALLLLPAFEYAAHGAPQKNKKSQPAAVAGALLPDKGKLKILLDGKSVATEEFEISPSAGNWTAHGTTEMEPPGSKHTRVTSTFRLANDGTPQNYEWEMKGEKSASGSVAFQGGVATVQVNLGGRKPFEEQHTFGSPRIAILDNNLYHHYAILARLYDWNKKGKQSLPVLVPQAITPGTIDIEGGSKENVDGASYETLKLTTPDLAVTLYLDASHRLMRLAVPASKVIVVRE